MVQCCLPALRTTSVAIAISIEASTVLLCLGGFFDADNSRGNSQHKQQEPHDRFPNVAQEAHIRNWRPYRPSIYARNSPCVDMIRQESGGKPDDNEFSRELVALREERRP